MAKNSPNLMKTKILIYISKKFNKTPNKISTKKSTTKHIIFKLEKDEKKMERTMKETIHLAKKTNTTQLTAGLSEVTEARGQWMFRKKNNKTLSTKNSISRKLCFKTEGKIKTFHEY